MREERFWELVSPAPAPRLLQDREVCAESRALAAEVSCERTLVNNCRLVKSDSKAVLLFCQVQLSPFLSQKPKSELVRTSLRLLTSSAYRLQSECTKTLPVETCPTTDIQLVTQQVIQCAYDIAKAAKQLVTITTKENNN